MPFFEKNVWNHENINSYQKEIVKIYKIILEIISDKLSFTKTDTSYLIKKTVILL